MPAAALGLKKYLRGTFAGGSKTCDNEDATASLRDSEKLRVKNSPRAQIPEVVQATEDGEQFRRLG